MTIMVVNPTNYTWGLLSPAYKGMHSFLDLNLYIFSILISLALGSIYLIHKSVCTRTTLIPFLVLAVARYVSAAFIYKIWCTAIFIENSLKTIS